MSLQINGHGTREGVLNHIEAVTKEHLAKVPAGTDETQVKAVRELLVSEINAIKPEYNAVRVTAEVTAMENVRSIQVTIIPMKMHL